MTSMTLPDAFTHNLLTVLQSASGLTDADTARKAAACIREYCGESDLTRLLDRLAEKVEWLEASPKETK